MTSLDLVIEKLSLLTVSPGGATLCYKFDQYTVSICVQNITALKLAKNHTNWIEHCEDVGSQTYGLSFEATL